MACICQYFSSPKMGQNSESIYESINTEHIVPQKSSKFQNVVSATELASAKAEIWVLQKNLFDAEITIENLENLVKTVVQKQNELTREIYELRRQNTELQEECRMQREYQTMERNAIIQELHDTKLLLAERTKILAETVYKNDQLTDAIQDANEKIYMMGMKYFKLKSSRSKSSRSEHSGAECSARSDM